jgi:FkbM family methyltransferase
MKIRSIKDIGKALEVISNPHAKLSFSSFGEDLVCAAILKKHLNGRVGFYVDVGCHHPFRASNTALFYMQGWQGINIDADLEAIKFFDQFRPRDINIAKAIGANKREGFFYKFKDLPAVNTLSNSMAIKQSKNFKQDFITEKLEIVTLGEILENNLQSGKLIDLLTIDAEGLDLEVISGLDFDKYRPLCIIIEDFTFDFSSPNGSSIYSHLIKNNYKLIARCYVSSIFISTQIHRRESV